MNPRFYIESITYNNDQVLQCDKNDIIVFVGANNAGKSASLKEIALKFRSKATSSKIIKDIQIGIEGTQELFADYIEKNSIKNNNSGYQSYSGYGYNIGVNDVQHYVRNFQNGIDALFPIYANVLNTEQRLTASNPAQNIQLTKESNQHPIHFLQKSDEMEKKFSDYFNIAFGKDLIVHRNAGTIVPLYVGKKPIPKEGEDRVSEGYLRELEKLALLHEQGDGMRSFVGVILNSFVPYFRILFIDEPEAFLHPPQARLLGKMLAKELSDNKQIFLSTHSEDFLKGLLETNSKRLKILRIERNGDINNISILNSSDIEVVWKDSILRHSNILSGLFHSKVILCESDSDCRLFSAILSSIYEDSGNIVPDILFTHCGGKHRMPVVVKALRKLNVPVTVVADFDI